LHHLFNINQEEEEEEEEEEENLLVQLKSQRKDSKVLLPQDKGAGQIQEVFLLIVLV